MKKRLKWSELLLCGLLLILMTSCNANASSKECKEGEYLVYYISQDGYSLVSCKKAITATEPVEIAKLLFANLKTSPDKHNLSLLGEQITLLQVSLQEETLILNVSAEYEKLSDITELQARAALLKTLGQIQGVTDVTLLIEGKPFSDLTGFVFENIRPEEYILDLENEVIHKKVTLYFSDESGSHLVEETRELICQNDKAVEQLIIEALLAGPQKEGRYPVFSDNISVPRVWVREGICYVNFSSDFLKNKIQVKDILPVYSIVNSLSELYYVAKVQFLIDGVADVTFRDTVSFKQLYERNLDIVVDLMD